MRDSTVTSFVRSTSLTLVLLALAGAGCGQTNVNDPGYPSQSEAAPEVSNPAQPPATAPAETKAAP